MLFDYLLSLKEEKGSLWLRRKKQDQASEAPQKSEAQVW